MPTLSMIVASSENGVIGANGDLPWGRSMPADLERFKNLTTKMGTVVMGRKTAESLPKALSGRKNLVLSRSGNAPLNKGFVEIWSPGCIAHHVAPDAWVAVIGGAEIYRLLAPYSRYLDITRIHADFEGDTRLPVDAFDAFKRMKTEHHYPDEKNAYERTVYTLRNANPLPLPPRSQL